jgi:hypothetical protein
MKILLTASALILFMTGAAIASDTTGGTVLTSGPISLFYDAGGIDCDYVNFGTTNITPVSQELFEDNSTTPIPTTAGCANGVAITPNQTCFVYPTDYISDGGTYSCKLTFSTAATHVRGTFITYDSNGIRSVVELR